jgi:transcriptional regulator with XRE-family HTH domain
MISTTLLMPPNRDSVPGLAVLLKEAREAARLSQVQAGQKSGVHHVSIAKFETEKATPTLRVLYLLAAAYGVDVCDLLPPAPKSKGKR